MSAPGVNKVYLNNSTRISLNDRFSIMQSVGPKPGSGGGGGGGGGSAPAFRRRSRSRSRSRTRNPVVRPQTAGSVRNRQLLDSLEKKHKMAAALKIKNRSIRGGQPRLNRERRATKRMLRSALTTMGGGGGVGGGIGRGLGRRLRRSNSLANIATMNADLEERGRLRRSNSQSSLAGRLGNRRRQSTGRGRQQLQQQLNSGGRRRLKRSNSIVNLRRSNSRGNLARANSQNNLVPTNRSRSRSRTRGGNMARGASRGRSNSRNRQPVHTRLGDSSGRMLAAAQRNRANSQTRRGALNMKRGVARARSASGVRRRGGAAAKNTVIRGRIFKRTPGGLARTGGNNQTVKAGNGRMGRTLNRGAAVAGRGRSRSRPSRSSVRNQQATQQPAMQGQGRNRRRRGRGRGALTGGQSLAVAGAGRRGRGGKGKAGASGPPKTPKSREELDNEIEQYMANTKSCIDQEMEEYMKGI